MKDLKKILRIACFSGCLIALSAAIGYGTVPEGQPVFSNPLEIDNPYRPFQPGAIRVYEVTEGDITLEIIVDVFINETRTFTWNGAEVACRIVESLDFEDGKLTGLSRKFFAQADDGTVYFFGELSETYLEADVVLRLGSWLVGGPTLPSDPLTTEWRADPTIAMPAQPEIGDQFKREDIPPVLDELNEVVATGIDLFVFGSQYKDTIELVETSTLEPGFQESKWYAPGIGVVKAFDGEALTELIGTTLSAAKQTGIDFSFWDVMHK